MKTRLFRFFVLLFCIGATGQVFAHELQPASLELRQLTPERFELIWRAPVYYRKPHPATLQLPESWQTLGEPTVRRRLPCFRHRRPELSSRATVPLLR